MKAKDTIISFAYSTNHKDCVIYTDFLYEGYNDGDEAKVTVRLWMNGAAFDSAPKYQFEGTETSLNLAKALAKKVENYFVALSSVLIHS